MKHSYKVWNEYNSDKVLFTAEAGPGGHHVRLRSTMIDPDDWQILTKNEAQDLIGALMAALLDVDEKENVA